MCLEEARNIDEEGGPNVNLMLYNRYNINIDTENVTQELNMSNPKLKCNYVHSYG